VGVARLVLESARNDICEEMASVYNTRVERQSKVRELEEALVDRQTAKTALEQELRNLQSLLADSMQNDKAREHQMSDVLGDLQQASCKVFVLENAKKELEEEVAALRTKMDAVTCNAKKV
jgi:chromosome segregation ATPase